MSRRGVSVALLFVALLRSAPSVAQDATTKATAEALFADGRRLMNIGEYAAACPKLAASQRLDPGIGTALNLADCYERSGRFASAWAEFRAAITAAHAAGSTEREQLASERARALESKLSYLTITTSPAQAASTAIIQISRDGNALDSAVLGTPIPVDPGHHTLEAKAPGKKAWSESFDVTLAPTQVTVKIPDLADDNGAPSAVHATPSDKHSQARAQRGVGIAVGAVGVLGVTAGTIFGLRAKSIWDDAKRHCPSYPGLCDQQGVALGQDAKQAGDIATVAFVIGGAGLIGGAILYFTAPKDAPEKALSLHISPSSVTVGGRF
jgi:hypothetical protein